MPALCLPSSHVMIRVVYGQRLPVLHQLHRATRGGGVAQQGVDEDSNGNHDDFCRPRNSLLLLLQDTILELILEGRGNTSALNHHVGVR